MLVYLHWNNTPWSQGGLRFIPQATGSKDTVTTSKYLLSVGKRRWEIALGTGANGHAAILFLLLDKLMQDSCSLR